jgi:cytochrome P450
MEAMHPPPRTPGLPVLGDLSILKDSVKYLVAARKYGDIVGVRVLNLNLALTYTPEAAEHVLLTNRSNYKKDQYIQRAFRVFGNGLLRAEGSSWLQQRRLMQPGFHKQRVRGYGETMRRLSSELVARLTNDAEVDFHKLMTALTMDITVATMFGQDLGIMSEHVADHMTAIMGRFEAMGYLFEPDWWPSPSQLRYKRAIAAVNRVIHEIIERRKRAPGDDVLSMLLEMRDEAGNAMSEEQVRDEVMTLFIAGHETTALNLVFAWRLLAQHPSIATALRDEVRAAGAFSLETLGRSPLLDQVIKESLRLYPPVYGIPREALGDDVIGGYSIAAGTRVVLCVQAMHNDPTVFRDPDKFKPERWTTDFQASLHRYSYFPFGGGPRMCIGAAFADLETKVVLGSLIAHYKPTLASDAPMPVVPSLTQRPRYGLPVRLVRWD